MKTLKSWTFLFFIWVISLGNLHAQTNAKFINIAGGKVHSLGRQEDGRVWAWGGNSHGQLGNGTEVGSKEPVQVVGPNRIGFLENVQAIAAGGDHSLALLNDGTVWAWGGFEFGQTEGFSSVPIQVRGPNGIGFLENVQAIAAGENHSLALLNDGTVWAWGNNRFGQLGTASTGSAPLFPVQVRGLNGLGFLQNVQAIAAGDSFSLALLNDGTVCAWGNNRFGQLGFASDLVFSSIPRQVTGPDGIGFLQNVEAIAAGGSHSLASNFDPETLIRSVWAWGQNSFGQLGNGTNTNSPFPVKVQGIVFQASPIAVAAGENHSLALVEPNILNAWGNNEFGQLGNGSKTNSNVAVLVKGPGDLHTLGAVESIASGANHSLAFRSVNLEGTHFWDWGRNNQGQLGNNSLINASRPVPVYLSPVISTVFPPRHLRGLQKLKRNGDRINVLTWKTPKIGNPPNIYRIYRNSLDNPIGEVTDLQFKDRNVKKGKTYTYFVVSIDEFDNVSQPASVKIKGKKFNRRCRAKEDPFQQKKIENSEYLQPALIE